MHELMSASVVSTKGSIPLARRASGGPPGLSAFLPLPTLGAHVLSVHAVVLLRVLVRWMVLPVLVSVGIGVSPPLSRDVSSAPTLALLPILVASLTSQMALSKASMKRNVLNVGTALGFDAKPCCHCKERTGAPHCKERTGSRHTSGGTTARERLPRPLPLQPRHLCSAVLAAGVECGTELMPARAGERVRLVHDAAAALCAIYVEDDDWDWCFASRQR